jgi:glycosidase
LYRELLALRRRHGALSIGSFELMESDEEVLAYERRYEGERLLVALNLGARRRQLNLPGGVSVTEVLASTGPVRPIDGTLAPDEALVLRLESDG